MDEGQHYTDTLLPDRNGFQSCGRYSLHSLMNLISFLHDPEDSAKVKVVVRQS